MKKIIMALIFIAVIIFAIQDNSNSSNLKNEYLDEIVTLIENKEYDKVLTMKAPDVLDDSYKREEKILKIYAKALLYILDDELIRMMGQGMIDDYDLERLAMIGAIYKFDNFYHCIFITEEIPRLLICNPVERTFKFFNGLKKNGTYESVESHRFIKLSLR